MVQKKSPKPQKNPQAKHARRYPDDKFKYAFEYSVTGSSITLPTGEIHVNQAFCEMLGYSQVELEKCKWQEVTHPDDVELTQSEINLLISGEKEAARFIKRFIHKNGSIIWADLGSRLRRDQDGKPLYLITSINDITERKETEEKLRESEETLRVTLENISDPVFITNEAGDFTFICPNVSNSLYFSMEEIRAMGNIKALIGEKVFSPNEQATGEGFSNVERVIFDKKGNRRIFLMNSKRVCIGKGTHLYALHDITESKQAETALLENKLAAEQYLNIAAEIIVSLDSEGNITHLNESGHQLLEYQTGLIGKNWFDTCVPKEERDEVRRFFEMLKTGKFQNLESRENNIVTSSGERKTILWHNTILKDADGEFAGTLSSGEDITNRIEVEKSLRIALAKYKTLFEYFPLGVTIADGAGYILETNPAAAKLLSVPREEHTQRSIDGAEWRIIRPNGDPMPSEEYPSVRALKENRLIENVEMGIVKPDHSTTWISVNAISIPLEGQGVVVTYSDITARKRAENLLQARLYLSQYAESHTLDELLQKMLDEAEALTNSQIGFAHLLEEDQKTLELQMWSTNTVKNMCAAEGKGQHYAVDEAGVWVECVYMRAPVIHNDYATLPHRKGLPLGHAPVLRELLVPVIRRDLIVAIFGVGNKPSIYTNEDVDTVLQLANLTWDIIQRKRAEEALKVSEKKYRLLHESMIDGFVRADMSGHILEYNHVYRDMLGYPDAELASLTYFDITPEKWRTFEADIVENQILRQGYSDIYEKEYRRKDGSIFPVELRTVLLRNEQKEPSGMWAIVRDITKRKQAEEALRESEAKNRALVDAMPDLIFVHNRAGVYIEYHAAKLSLLATPPDIFVGRTPHDIFSPELASPMHSKLELAFQTGHIQTHEYKLDMADGCHYFEARINAYDNDRAISVIREITERKRAEETLETTNLELQASLNREKQLAHTDMLTGVNNRRNLYELAAHEFEISIRYHQPLSVLMFDLDLFKKVNDTFGHTVGDQILVQVTQVARAELRSADYIGRYGGEEFLILLPMTNARQAYALAERIRENVAKICVPTPIGDATVTLSTGIVEVNQQVRQAASIDDLIR
jgi:diguanylate cyclase (GGDEF)-like protein/PAS domain S-box-containing protein